MTFSNAEVAFLSQGSGNRGNRGWAKLTNDDFRTCPPRIMDRILERRAKMLGREFTAFQEEQRRLAAPNAPFRQDSLKDQLDASSLF
jgi:hypothetical protein